jgi:hypothetical protein
MEERYAYRVHLTTGEVDLYDTEDLASATLTSGGFDVVYPDGVAVLYSSANIVKIEQIPITD